MDWDFAIERQREALKRVLATLFAMAGLAELPFSPFMGSKRWPGEAGANDNDLSFATAEGRLEGADEGQCRARPTLPRQLHRAMLRLLRPAEAAARRLVIMAARGVVVTLPPPHPRKSPPEHQSKGGRPGRVTGIWMPPQRRMDADRLPSAGRRTPPPRRLRLPLFDPLPRMGAAGRRAARENPRLCVPGWSAPPPAPPARRPKGLGAHGPDDPIDALRLALRLRALAAALDDLPREAERFARWRARTAAGARARNEDRAAAGPRGGEASRPARARRVWPLRPGRLPSPSRRAGLASCPSHAVHDVLRDTHALACRALESPDSS